MKDLKNSYEMHAEAGDKQKFLPHDSSPEAACVNMSSVNDVPVFTGLTKEQVMAYGSNPTWVRARWIIFAIFWGVWVGMFALSIVLVYKSDGCPIRPKMEWWQKETIYQLDVANFKDSNGDGQGDIQGVNEKIDHFVDLGMKTVSLDYILSTDKESKTIDPKFGQAEDLKNLKIKAISHDMHLMMSVPISLLDGDEASCNELLTYWLTEAGFNMDGLRITGLEHNKPLTQEQTDKLTLLNALTKKISDKTFKMKFLAVDNIQAGTVTEGGDVLPVSTTITILGSEAINPSEIIKKPEAIIDTLNTFYSSFNVSKHAIQLTERDTENNKMIRAMSMLLPGTLIVNYGDELSHRPTKVMKWNNIVETMCGFTSNLTLARANTDCKDSAQEGFAAGPRLTIARAMQKLNQLRQEPSFQWGKFETGLTNVSPNVISFVRNANRFDSYLVAACVEPTFVDFTAKHPNLAAKAHIQFFYSSEPSNLAHSDFRFNQTVNTNRIKMQAGDLLVLKFNSTIEHTGAIEIY